MEYFKVGRGRMIRLSLGKWLLTEFLRTEPKGHVDGAHLAYTLGLQVGRPWFIEGDWLALGHTASQEQARLSSGPQVPLAPQAFGRQMRLVQMPHSLRTQ